MKEIESAVVAFVRACLRGARGSVVPLGGVLGALRKVLPVERVAFSVLARARAAAAQADALPGGAGGPFSYYGVGAEDGTVDVAEEGFVVQPSDDPGVARVLGGAPAVIHRLEPEAPVDRALWMKGIRSTAVFPLLSPGGVVFGTLMAGSTLPDGLVEGARALLAAVAEELRAPLWRAVGAAARRAKGS
jgi:GAF domain-containing protein